MVDAAQPKPFAEWIGRETESLDVVTERLVLSFRAIFEPNLASMPDNVAPLGLHWCLSPAIAAMDQLGADGHPAKNLTLPPVPLPRRMWAGGGLETFDMLRIGDSVRRVSTISDIVHKEGRSGELWFVAVDHRYYTDRGLALSERQNIVYRQAAAPSKAGPPEGSSALAPPASPIARSWSLSPSATLLFRYSAITFNGHRIHYDLPYATQSEGYEGLVVHGPIQATLLLNLAAVCGSETPITFRYRGVAPAIADRELSINWGVGANAKRFWTQSADGIVHMEADIEPGNAR